MDKLSLFGLLVALGGILGGQMLEGGSASVLLQMAAFLIVFGGTIGAVMLQHPMNVFMIGLKMGGWVFVTPQIDTQKLAYQITAWGSVARLVTAAWNFQRNLLTAVREQGIHALLPVFMRRLFTKNTGDEIKLRV